jgi:flagellar basal body-associated protein FliL
MANRSKRRSQRQLQIIMGIFAILVILSMVVSLVWSFSTPTPPVTSSQPQPTVIVITPAP